MATSEDGYFDEAVAARYDDSESEMFDPAVVAATVEFLAELLDPGTPQRQVYDAVGDPADLLGRNVARLAERLRRDRQPVEDVRSVVAGDLVDLADLGAVGGEHLPAGPDQQPRDGVGHVRSPR